MHNYDLAALSNVDVEFTTKHDESFCSVHLDLYKKYRGPNVLILSWNSQILYRALLASLHLMKDDRIQS